MLRAFTLYLIFRRIRPKILKMHIFIYHDLYNTPLLNDLYLNILSILYIHWLYRMLHSTKFTTNFFSDYI